MYPVYAKRGVIHLYDLGFLQVEEIYIILFSL